MGKCALRSDPMEGKASWLFATTEIRRSDNDAPRRRLCPLLGVNVVGDDIEETPVGGMPGFLGARIEQGGNGRPDSMGGQSS